MVALQRHGHGALDTTGGYDPVVAARARVERLQAGLPRALLASRPADVRAVAARAAEAEARVGRRRAALGPRPPLDEVAEGHAHHALAGYRRATVVLGQASDACHRMLAVGNAAGAGCLAVAGLLYGAGLEVVATPVAAAVLAAAGGPVAGLVLGLHRRQAAARTVTAARAAWASALERTGLETMGALAARRLAVDAWDRRRRELDVLADTARRRRRSWQVLTGPGVSPDDVEVVVARLDELRSAQLALLAALLERRMRGPSSSVEAEAEAGPPAPAADRGVALVALDARPPGEAEEPREPAAFSRPGPHQRRLEEALERLRSGKLRLWAFRTGA